jgi:adenosine deaminase
VVRTLPPEQVFAQCLLGFELARREGRFVGLNLVAPEDDPVALRDYATHMRMLAYLGQHYSGVKLSLHAGELTLGLVPPNDLRSHIRQAVEIARARRIGHGVDVMQEDNAADLLRDMGKRHVLVEINLTSNDLILGVRGREHPLRAYMHAGVPAALSTDDEGVAAST